MSTELLKKMAEQKSLLDAMHKRINGLYHEQRVLEEGYAKLKMEYLFQSDILKESS